MEDRARYGWESDFPNFRVARPMVVRESLQRFIVDASREQIRAWDESIPELQREVGEIADRDGDAPSYTTILEYELPLESRRADAVLLLRGALATIELKGKRVPSRADIDQASAYARDLRCYHRDAQSCPVHALLVPVQARGYVGVDQGVHIVGPDAIDDLIARLPRAEATRAIDPKRFLSAEAYRPLPTIVQAARELFRSRTIRAIHRAKAATDPAIQEITRIIHEAARTRTRRLVLLTGVPGAGKTLVGLQVVHSAFLDDLAVLRGAEKPTAPAVFLSGNGPLVQVLQYEFSRHGVSGKAFVRAVFDYVKTYSLRRTAIPPHHVLVFDEAQRAFDAEQVREKHGRTPGFEGGKSEPEHLIEFAERIPEWCVVIGLIGGGQEIHVGEEAGIEQWRYAIEGSRDPGRWTIHGPDQVHGKFRGQKTVYVPSPRLNLDTEIRFHQARDLHGFVEGLLSTVEVATLRQAAERLGEQGYHLRITRELDEAKQYLKDRYSEHEEARYGIIASSKDRDLNQFGIQNDFQSTKLVKYGPWYADDEGDPGQLSCRHLETVVTEFGSQGLELEAALVAWGTDWVWSGSDWSNDRARGYKNKARIRDARQLRMNAYRVLLTRGRDATVVFVPDLAPLDATYTRLVAAGFLPLD